MAAANRADALAARAADAVEAAADAVAVAAGAAEDSASKKVQLLSYSLLKRGRVERPGFF